MKQINLSVLKASISLSRRRKVQYLLAGMVFNPRQKSTWVLNIQLERLTLSYTPYSQMADTREKTGA